jgi:hypothetical protein
MSTETKSIPRKALTFRVGEMNVGSNGQGAKTAPVKLLARSGEPISHWYWGNVVHDLAGMQLSKSRLPIDWCHTDELIGTLNKFDTSSGDLVASGFIKTNPARMPDHAAIVMNDSEGDDTIPYEASINFGGSEVVCEEIPEGFQTQVNGRQFTGPGIVIRKWTLRGVAICPYGADMHTATEMNESETVNITLIKQENATMSAEATPAEAPAAVETETPAIETAAPVAPVVELAQAEAQPATLTPAVVEAKPHEAYVAAFGDKGAMWFLEGKSLESCYAQHVGDLKTAHEAEVTALKSQIEDLKTRLAAMPRGESPISHSPADVDPNAARVAELTPKVGANLARVAAGIKFAGKK